MAKGPVKEKLLKRRTLRTAVITIIAVLACVVIFFIAQNILQSSSNMAQQAAVESSTTIATSMSDLLTPAIKKIQVQLAQLAKNNEIVVAFKSGNEEQIKQSALENASKFADALKLRFFKRGKYDLDYESKPNLGFASIDLLKKVEESKAPSKVEVHNPGSEDAHIVFVEPVLEGQEVLGLMHLSMPASLYEAVVKEFKLAEGYAELQQSVIGGTVDLNSLGDKQYKIGTATATAKVSGTQWKFAHWSSSLANSGNSSLLSLVGSLVLLILAGLAGWYYLGRGKDEDDANYFYDEDDGVIYQGAVRAIMDGAHPGVEKLISNLPRAGQSRSINLLDEAQVKEKPDVSNLLTEDTFDITEASEEPEPVQEVKPEKKPVQVDPSIFRAYDIRGIVGNTLTKEVVEAIGKAIGSEAKTRGQASIAIGRDGRTHGPELQQELVNGIASTGVNVINVGMVPTPVLYFATHHLDVHSGVMLTGSHNPPDYNGMKIVLGGDSLSGDDIQGLKNRIIDNNFATGVGEVSEVDVKADYIRRITDDIPVALGRSFKIVVDAGNGVAGELSPQLYRALGHEVIDQYCEVDGNFPNHHPDPSQPENIAALIQRVKDEKADLGFAFDGDGDRLGIVDSLGNVIWPDRQMILLAEDVLSRNPGAPIIYDVKCSRYLTEAIEAAGGKALMWKTGHSLIKKKMKEVDSPLAGEMSGHIFFKERWYGFDDALYTGARVLEILVNNELSPTEVFAFIPEDVSTPELRARLDEMEHAGFMEELFSQSKFDGANVVDIDGLRADYPDGWGLVRPSNTSPYLVMRFEAEDEEVLQRIKTEFKAAMLKVKPDLEMPF